MRPGRPSATRPEGTAERTAHLRTLTLELAESLPRWREAIAPLAEEVGHTLGAVIAGKFVPAMPLTSSRAKAAQAVVKARKAETSTRSRRTAAARQMPSDPSSFLLGCVDYGATVTNARHVRYGECIA